MASLPPNVRKRSPRYPNHSLDSAIEYAKAIYDGVHRSPVSSETAFKLMGFSGKSGASATALGSVRQYGLVDGIGDNTRISDLALRILEPASSDESSTAIVEAAHEPQVFHAISERFNDKIPLVDEPIRAYLIRELGFSKSGVDECISSLRKTISFVGRFMDLADRVPAEDAQPRGSNENSPAMPLGNSTPSVAAAGVTETIRLKLSKECSVELRFEGQLDVKALDSLMRHVELIKEVWAEG